MDEKLHESTPAAGQPGPDATVPVPLPDTGAPDKPAGRLARFALPVLCVLLLSAFPVLFLYFNNVTEVAPGEILLPLALFCGAGLLILLLAWLLMPSHSLPKAAVAAGFFILALANYSYLGTLAGLVSSRLKLWHILPVVLAAGLCLAFVIHRKLKPGDGIRINAILSFAFAALILVNTITALPGLLKSGGENAPAADPVEVTNTQPMPNVYWLIFDEFSPIEMIQKYYDYDNTALAEDLVGLGFTVNGGCRNESAETATVIANYINVDIVANDDMPTPERQAKWVNGQALQLARRNGYRLIPVNLASRFGLEPVVGRSDASDTGTVEGASFFDLVLGQTVAGSFLSGVSNAKINAVTDSFAYLQNPANFPEASGFTISYMLAPHQPFYFNAEGELNPPSAFHDWVNKEYYLGYYLYVSGQIRAIAHSIVENDPDSVVILQSDHAARYLADADGNRYVDAADKTHAFCAVYYRGESMPEIQGLSGVNTLRTVFSRLYGMDMPLREVASHG